MSYKSKFVGWDRSERGSPMKYHWADRNGRMYLCSCFMGWRINGEIVYPLPTNMKKWKWNLKKHQKLQKDLQLKK